MRGSVNLVINVNIVWNHFFELLVTDKKAVGSKTTRTPSTARAVAETTAQISAEKNKGENLTESWNLNLQISLNSDFIYGSTVEPRYKEVGYNKTFCL